MNKSEENNLTLVTKFFLLGFQVSQNLRLFMFFLLLCVNCCTICGNLLIITLVSTSKILHTPMYFFLTQLSISDLLVTTDIVPNMLHLLLNNGGTISFLGCMTQLYFFCASEIFECLLLSVMSYDRYVAICNPLRYTSIMTSEYCVKCIAMCWLGVVFVMIINTLTLLKLRFCGNYIIDHFFCDLVPLLDIACSGTYLMELELFTLGPVFLFIPVIIVIVSYINIIATVFKIQSNLSRQKAFSTCSSHLMVVSIFYWTMLSVYVFPAKVHSSSMSKILSLLYTVFTPFINPIIYCLRNKDIVKAGKEQIAKSFCRNKKL